MVRTINIDLCFDFGALPAYMPTYPCHINARLTTIQSAALSARITLERLSNDARRRFIIWFVHFLSHENLLCKLKVSFHDVKMHTAHPDIWGAIRDHQGPCWAQSGIIKDNLGCIHGRPRNILGAVVDQDHCGCNLEVPRIIWCILVSQRIILGQPGITKDQFGHSLGSPRIILGALLAKDLFGCILGPPRIDHGAIRDHQGSFWAQSGITKDHSRF